MGRSPRSQILPLLWSSSLRTSWPECLAGQVESKERLKNNNDPSDISIHHLVGTYVGVGLQHLMLPLELDPSRITLPCSLAEPALARAALGGGKKPHNSLRQ